MIDQLVDRYLEHSGSNVSREQATTVLSKVLENYAVVPIEEVSFATGIPILDTLLDDTVCMHMYGGNQDLANAWLEELESVKQAMTMQPNPELEHMAEEAECVKMLLDKAGTPTEKNGQGLSLVGRVQEYAKKRGAEEQLVKFGEAKVEQRLDTGLETLLLEVYLETLLKNTERLKASPAALYIDFSTDPPMMRFPSIEPDIMYEDEEGNRHSFLVRKCDAFLALYGFRLTDAKVGMFEVTGKVVPKDTPIKHGSWPSL